MKRLYRHLWMALLAASISVPATSATGEVAKYVFGSIRTPSSEAPEPHGSYARGCLSGAVALPETGPGWQAMRLSRNRTWGHPETIAFIGRLSQGAKEVGWPRIYVGDISQPRGGPMNGGHRSHQTGLDVDIWLRMPGAMELNAQQREEISSRTVVRADRLGVNEDWRPEHHALLRLAARDPAVARIFVNAAIKKALCEGEPPGDRGWLQKVRSWYGHESHFHVRLNCPADAAGCAEQDSPPPGDGCGGELAWWFSDEVLHPKPDASGRPSKPRELALNDLPAACQGPVLQ